jgi:hypothetical protein
LVDLFLFLFDHLPGYDALHPFPLFPFPVSLKKSVVLVCVLVISSQFIAV